MNDELVLEANRLYWESQKSVNQIADELDLSKGALYGAIEPLVVDQACPRCASLLGYANRTAHERGDLTCASCGYGSGDEAPSRVAAPAGSGGAGASPRVIGARATSADSDGSAHRSSGTRALVGGAALCLGVGLLLGRILPRR
jgi:hypothetical protein